MAAELFEPSGDQAEMVGLFFGDPDPVAVVGFRHLLETVGGIQREVDGVKFDVRDGMQHGADAFTRTEAAAWYFFGRNQCGRCRSPCIGYAQDFRRLAVIESVAQSVVNGIGFLDFARRVFFHQGTVKGGIEVFAGHGYGFGVKGGVHDSDVWLVRPCLSRLMVI